MPDDALGEDMEDTVALLGAEVFRFVRTYPDHYAARSLVDVMARESEGGHVAADERMMALTSVVQALRERRRP
jgi:hypothetical protein